jgi:Domain of unknown function (DUF6249)
MHGEFLIPIVMFATVFGILYLFFNTRNKERMALIEKGVGADIFRIGNKNRGRMYILRFGMLFTGIAIGILIGYLLKQSGMDEGVAFPSMIFLFSGIFLIVNFITERKLNKNSPEGSI